MKLFKRVALAAVACAMALSALTGCSSGSNSFTINGTISLAVNGEKVITDAPLTAMSDGSSTYTKYEYQGTVIEALQTGSDYYQRAYAAGDTDTKWTKSAAQTATATTASSTAKTGTMTIDGTEYETMTYDDITYYCLLNNELKCIYSSNDGDETTIKIDSMSADVDESLLKAPDASMVESAS